MINKFTLNPERNVYVSKDGTQVLGFWWETYDENIDGEYRRKGFDCYTLADLYNVDKGFDLSKIPDDPVELEDLEGHGLTLVDNLEQFLFKSTKLPTERKAVGQYVNWNDGWTKK